MVQKASVMKTSQKSIKAAKKTSLNRRADIGALFENHPIPMWVYDLKTFAFLAVNDAAVEKYGYTRAEFKRMTIKDIRPGEDVNRLVANVERERPAPQHSGEWQHLLKGGRVIDVEISSHTLKFKKHDAVLVMAQDITKRKRVENALLESETRFRKAIEAAGAVPYFHDYKTNTYSFMGDGILSLTGYSAQEITPTLYGSLQTEEHMVGEASSMAVQEASKLMRAGRLHKWRSDSYVTTKKGNKLWIADTSVPVFAESGEVIGSMGFLQDFTERKRAEEESLFLASIVESASDAITGKDLEGNILSWNPGAERLYGYSAQEVIGKSVSIIYPPEKLDELSAIMERIKRGERIEHYETERVAKDGHRVDISLTVSPIRDKAKKIVGASAIGRDITERKKTAEELYLTNQRLRRFVDSNIVGIVIAAPSGKVIEANDYYLNLIGYTHEEFEQGKVDWRASTPDEWSKVDEKAIAELRERGTCTPYEKEYLLRDGKRVSVFLTDVLLPGPEEQIAAFVLDITERKRAEDELRTSEERYHSLFDNMLNGFAYCKMLFEDGHPQDFIYLEVNRAFETLTGLKDVAGKKVSDVIPGIRESDPKLFEIYGRVALTGKPESFETYLDALQMWFSVSVYSPKKEYFVAVFDVITERKKAEENLRKSEEQYRTTLDTMMEGAQIISKDWRYLYINDTAAEQGRQPKENLLGHTMMEVYPGIENTALFTALEQCMKERIHQQMDNEFIYSNGDSRWFKLSIQPVPEGIFILSMDITERRRAEIEILKLNMELEGRVARRTMQLEAANKELEAFSYSVSHDLRAPLRAIDGFSLALLEDYASELPAEAQNYLQRVRASAQRMATLIDDMLNLSRVTRKAIEPRPVNLSEIAEQVCVELQQTQPERQVTFSITPNLTVNGDPHLIKIALENLLGNAWKFTSKQEHAHIEFGVLPASLPLPPNSESFGEEKDGSQTFFVRDNGAGFDMTYAGKLFGAFQRLHSLSEFPGTGIGLATVQRIIHKHGGRIWAEGKVGEGATFYFTF